MDPSLLHFSSTALHPAHHLLNHTLAPLHFLVLQRLPITLPELVEAAPSMTADGSLILGRRRSQVGTHMTGGVGGFLQMYQYANIPNHSFLGNPSAPQPTHPHPPALLQVFVVDKATGRPLTTLTDAHAGLEDRMALGEGGGERDKRGTGLGWTARLERSNVGAPHRVCPGMGAVYQRRQGRAPVHPLQPSPYLPLAGSRRQAHSILTPVPPP
jgi:hypothetical protein